MDRRQVAVAAQGLGQLWQARARGVDLHRYHARLQAAVQRGLVSDGAINDHQLGGHARLQDVQDGNVGWSFSLPTPGPGGGGRVGHMDRGAQGIHLQPRMAARLVAPAQQIAPGRRGGRMGGKGKQQRRKAAEQGTVHGVSLWVCVF